MKKKYYSFLLCMTMMVSLCGCSGGSAQNNSGNETVQNVSGTQEQKPEETNTDTVSSEQKTEPVFTAADPQTVESIYNDADKLASIDAIGEKLAPFSVKLLRTMFDSEENHIFSPMSLVYALSLTENGTAGATRAEIESVLGVSTDDLSMYLSQKIPGPDDYDSNLFYTGNSLWFNTDNDLKIRESYRRKLSEYYNAAIFEQSFADTGALADEINSWTSDHTDGAIPDIISSGDINKTDPMLLLNALAAGSKWALEFDSALTTAETFHNGDGTESTVGMMHQSFDGWWHDDYSEGVVLFLENGLTFTAILPNAGMSVSEYLEKADPDMILNYYKGFISADNIDNKTWEADVHITNLSLPRYSYDAEYEVDETLKKLGIQRVFAEGYADFSELAEGDPETVENIYVRKINQKAEILVNEEEVKASAATVVVGGLGAGAYSVRQYIYHDIVLDRPFLFFLGSGNVPLFAGVASCLENDESAASGSTGLKRIEVITESGINVRSGPSVTAEKYYTAVPGTQFYVYETKENEGYTWYRINDFSWIADQNGEWVRIIE